MKFLYNGEKLEELRVKEVAEDITSYYTKIPHDLALFIARLESPITTSKDDIMVFKRLYNIIFVLSNKTEHNDIFQNVLSDFSKIYNKIIEYKENEEFELIDNIYKEVLSYIRKERPDFPIISEFY